MEKNSQQENPKALAIVSTKNLMTYCLNNEKLYQSASSKIEELQSSNKWSLVFKNMDDETAIQKIVDCNRLWWNVENPEDSLILKTKAKSTKLALECSSPSISSMKALFNGKMTGEQYCTIVIAKLIIRAASLINVNNTLTDAQAAFTAEMIVEKYQHLKLGEIYYVLRKGAAGEFGVLYARLDTAVICEWFDKYNEERNAVAEHQEEVKGSQHKSVKTEWTLDAKAKAEKAKEITQKLLDKAIFELNKIPRPIKAFNQRIFVGTCYFEITNEEINDKLVKFYIELIASELAKSKQKAVYKIPTKYADGKQGELIPLVPIWETTTTYIKEKLLDVQPEKIDVLIESAKIHFETRAKILELELDKWEFQAERIFLSALNYHKPNTIRGFMAALNQCTFSYKNVENQSTKSEDIENQ